MKLSVRPAAVPRYTPNIPAYEAFLKAVYHGAKFTPESLALNRKYLEQAIALDPKFALAHNAIGGHFFVLACGTLQPAHEAIPSARAATQTALDIDSSLPEAQAALGVIAAVYDYNWKEADHRFRLAMARDPIPPLVRHAYGFWYLMAVGRPQDAADECERALKKDPLNVAGHTNLNRQSLTKYGKNSSFDPIQSATETSPATNISVLASVYTSLGSAPRLSLVNFQVTTIGEAAVMPVSPNQKAVEAGEPPMRDKFQKHRDSHAPVSRIPSRNYRHRDGIVLARAEIVENGGEIFGTLSGIVKDSTPVSYYFLLAVRMFTKWSNFAKPKQTRAKARDYELGKTFRHTRSRGL